MLHTLIGKKIGMTQVYDDANCLVPVTVIEAGPCPVTQVKNVESDGYNAVQIGFGQGKPKNLGKPLMGHLKASGATPAVIREVRCAAAPELKVGDSLDVSGFAQTAMVDVIGQTKGKGFQGVVRRYGFSGGPASHGSMFHRRGGSYGMCQWPGEVYKGKEMPGHMGQRRRTTQNLAVVKVVPEKNLILVKGSIPGANGDTVLVRASKKAAARAASKAA